MSNRPTTLHEGDTFCVLSAGGEVIREFSSTELRRLAGIEGDSIIADVDWGTFTLAAWWGDDKIEIDLWPDMQAHIERNRTARQTKRSAECKSAG